MLRAITACTFSTSQLPKVVRSWCVLCIVTWKCASRHNGVPFFDIATSKTLRCFVHFDFQMCFAPQRCALFDISTSKSAPNLLCFVHFDLEMCFAPQRRAIYHFSSGQLLRTRRFSEPTFRSSGASNHWKNTPTCSRTWIFFLWRLSLFDFLSSSLLFSGLFSISAFPSVHVVGSLTSKTPSIIYIYMT